MKQRILATLMSLCLMVGLLPTVALAEDSSENSTAIEIEITEDTKGVSYTFTSLNESTPYVMSSCVKPEIEKTLDNLGISSSDVTELSISTTGEARLRFADCVYIAKELTELKVLDITNADFYDDTYAGDWLSAANVDHKIPTYAFWESSSIETIYPFSGNDRSVTTKFTAIGPDAFAGTQLSGDIVIPNTVTEVAGFNGTKITGINKSNNINYFDGNIEVIGQACVYNTETFTGEVVFGDKVKKISSMAFQQSSISGTITIGASIKEIGSSAFQKCPNITSIYVGSGVENFVTNMAFTGCNALEGIIFEDGATVTIGSNPFTNCTNLKYIYCGDSVYYQGNFNCQDTVIVLSTSEKIASSYLNMSTVKDTIVYTGKGDVLDDLASAWKFNKGQNIIAAMNGGKLSNPEIYCDKTQLAEPVRDGYIFDGWYENENCTGAALVGTPQNGKTYYAKWIGMDDIELQYGGEQQITVTGVTLSGYRSDDLSVATVDEKGKVTATGVGTATISATGTYNGQQTTFKATVTVTPRVLTYTLTGGDTGSGSISYNYSGGHQKLSDYITFQWKDDPYTKVTLVEGTDINYTYTVTDSEGQGGGTAQTYDYLPMPVGNYDNVKFNLLNENYTFGLSGGGTRDYLEIDVHVVAQGSQRAYLASAWPKSDQNFVYTGEGVLPVEGTLNAYADNSTSSDPVDIGTFTVNIEGLNDTSFHSEVSGISAGTDLSSISGLTLPTEPGTYIITASAANDSYYLYKSLVFTISKATVTVKADDKSVYVGDAMPELTYTVSGLASGDSLSGTVSLSCEATDTNTAGTYTITPSGGAVPNTEHYNSEIVYQSGTLTVSTRSSGGGGGSSSGGSSSSNVSGSGDDVSISAGGGTVTDAQMESAVKKADKGSTITIKATSSTTVTLPVGGMADAADNDNDVLLDLRYGEVTMSARAIAGMTDGVSSNDKIKVSVANQTSSKNETISDLLDKGAAVFNVTVEVDGVEIHSFDGTLTITLTVSNLSKISDPHVLHILTNGTKEYYAPDRISGNTITVTGIRNLSTFAVIPGSEVPQSNPFTDVSTSDYYYDAVLWAADNGVTGGTSATTFSPNVTVTRAQMVTFLWRAHGSPKATGANPFTDVSTSDYYYDAVLWAVANGVTNGTSATTFSPDAPVTRAQAVTFQWRAAGSPVVSGSSFGDVAADAYYVNAVTWAVANGITNGTSDTTFSPDVVVSRAQAVTFLHRELG